MTATLAPVVFIFGVARTTHTVNPLRIKVIIPFPLKPAELRLREGSVPKKVLAPGVHLEFVPIRNGEYLDSYYTDLISEFFLLEQGMQAEKEGYDAVCIDTMSDTALNAVRSRLRIPVVSLFLVNANVACTLGNSFSVITAWERWVHLYKKNLVSYGLEDKCASIRAFDMRPSMGKTDQKKRTATLKALEDECKAAIDQDGADVIILGSATMHEYWEQIAKRFPVPVLNPSMVAVKFCEMCVALGLTHSKNAYQTPLQLHDDWVSKMVSAASVI